MQTSGVASLLATSAALLLAACGGGGPSSFGTGDGGVDAGGDVHSLVTGQKDGTTLTSPDTGTVVQNSCGNGATTTVTGTVYDPAAKNPLYDVVVYVPSTTVGPLPTGASCYSCNSLYSGKPVASAVTATDGTFTLTGVPAGAAVPLVIQVGKWRTQTTVAVTACTSNSVPDKTLTLPKNHMVGDLPQIAISTGGADTLECLLRRVGIDASEYEPGSAGPGHIHIFQGSVGIGQSGSAPTTNPPAPSSSQSLWSSAGGLIAYDLLLLSCEGSPTNVSGTDQQNLVDFTSAGGRVFASHYHYAWFTSGPFGSDNLADWTVHPFGLGSSGANISGKILTGFPKGAALDQWLGNVGALTSGELPIVQARFDAIVSASNSPSEAWISADQGAGSNAGATEYFSFNTPVASAATSQCGRVVFSDIHVSGAVSPADYSTSPTTPDGCTDADLTPQEKALEFMLFDLASCVVPDGQPPPPPPPVAK